MSSGVYRQDVLVYIECESCGFEGRVDGRFDPEVDRHSVAVDCPECGLDWEVRF